MIFNSFFVLIIIVIYIIIFLSKKMSKEIRNKLFLIISFSIIFFLMATRTYNTGTDTNMYIQVFKKSSQLKWKATIFGGYYEPLYAVLNILLSYISTNPRILIVFTSFFISYSFYKFIKDNSEDYFLSIIMFICLLIFYSTMNTIRQYIAMSIILLGFDFVKEKKIIPYIMIVVVACLFHTSAFIGFLIYTAFNMKYSRFRVTIIFVIAILSNIFISGLVNHIYELLDRTNYYNNRIGQENISNLIHVFIFLFMYMFSLFEIKKNKSNNEKNGFYLYIFVLASAFSLIAMKMNVLSRTTTYFNIFTIVCLPNIIAENIDNKNTKLFVASTLVLILLIYSSTIMYYRPEWNTAFNYHSCIFSDE